MAVEPLLNRTAAKYISFTNGFGNNCLSYKPIIKLSFSIAALLTFSTAAIAQLPEGWIEEPAIDGSIMYVDSKSEARIMLRSAPAGTEIDGRSFLTQLLPGIANTAICEGLAQAPIEQDGALFVVKATSDIASCSLWVADKKTPQVVLAIEPHGSNAGASNIARSLLVSNAPAVTQAPTTPELSQGEISSDTLEAALESVPTSHRPISIVSRSSLSFVGGMPIPSFSQWMIFDNGYATDCYDWDPAVTAPTPDTLPPECDVVRWRQARNLYQFQDTDDTWEEAEDYGTLLPFQKGERIAVDLVNKSGASGVETGDISVGSLSSGKLQMTKDGAIALGKWTSVVVSGSNVGGGASNKGAIVGQYYLDGYLIVIASPDGSLRRGFIAGDRETSGFYVYLNGDQYWSRE